MMVFRFIFFCTLLFLLQNCWEKTPAKPLHSEILPANIQPIEVKITDLNCWIEKGQFFVTGLCSNVSAGWQKIWLEATPVDAAGNPIAISGHASVILSTFSDAVPPQGRTAFFAFWPLAEFSGTPISCRIKSAGASAQPPGPILITQDLSSVKMLAPPSAGEPATKEMAWQVSGTLHNPLAVVALRPRLELLVFDTENRLWLSTLLDPEDSVVKTILRFERTGALQPYELRNFGLQVFYEHLPQTLKEKKIGRVEVLAFEAKQ